jgi:beta-glucosidase
MIDRRTMIAAGAALAAAPALAKVTARKIDPGFPKGFLWGTATAGHQVEGNNTNSDVWLEEQVKPSLYAEPSGDAANSFELWRDDLDLVQGLGLNTYRFSLEWARIEPAPGQFSLAMLDHYKAMIEGCRARGLTPMVTFNHFTAPVWFAARGGWSNPEAPQLFARFCDKAARHLAGGVGYATTLNEPNLPALLQEILPPQMREADRMMSEAAARASGSAYFEAANQLYFRNRQASQANLLLGHQLGRTAIKAVRGDLPVGVSLSMLDDEAVGKNSLRDAKREALYGPWLRAVKGDDFLGVQNYERALWSDRGKVAPPPDSRTNTMGSEVYAPSLAGAVRYAHAATGLPIMVTEHGVGTDDDSLRAWLIPAALAALKLAIDDGVPVLGYMHWSLVDNFEWVFGYRIHFGLHSLDRTTFKRTAKPSATVFSAIARANGV